MHKTSKYVWASRIIIILWWYVVASDIYKGLTEYAMPMVLATFDKGLQGSIPVGFREVLQGI